MKDGFKRPRNFKQPLNPKMKTRKLVQPDIKEYKTQLSKKRKHK